MKDLELNFKITTDGAVATQQLGAVGVAVRNVAQGTDTAALSMGKFTAAGFAINQIADAGGRLKGVAEEALHMAESFGQLKARLTLAVAGFGDAAVAMTDVQRIANATGQTLDATGQLYTKMAGAAKSMGLDQAQVATVTETVAQAMRVAGADGQSAAGAMLQFSQAMASGVLRGEDFNSVYEAAPYLIDQLAKGLGVATEDMRALAEAGQLSARQVAAALETQAGTIGAAYAAMPQTVDQAMQRVRNALTAYLGDANQASGASAILASAIGTLAEHVDLLGPVAAGAAAGGLAKLTQAGTAVVVGIKEQITAHLANRAALVESQAASVASARATAVAANAELASATSSQAAAVVRRVAAAQQLADMRELAIFGAARAAAEREMAAANAVLAASETALAGAQTKAAAASAAATAAMTASAGAGAVLSRALSFLGGPGGILLATVAGFAAFAFAQRDAKPPTEELTGALDRQREAMNKLGAQGLKKLIADEAEYQRGVRERLALAKDQAVALDEEAARIRAMTKAQQDRTGAEARLQAIEAQRIALGAQIEAGERDLAASVESVTTAQGRQNASHQQGATSLAALSKALAERKDMEEAVAKSVAGSLQGQIAAVNASAARAKAIGDETGALNLQAQAAALALTGRQAELAATQQAIARAQEEIAAKAASGQAKQAELEKIAQTITALEGEAASRRGAIAASEQEVFASNLAAATYGNQAAQVGVLTAQHAQLEAQLRSLTATQQAGVAASQALAGAQAQLTALEASLNAEVALGGAQIGELTAAYRTQADLVETLRARVEAGTAADTQAAQVRTELAATTGRLIDATSDLVAQREREAAGAGRQSQAISEESRLRETHLQNLVKEARARGDVSGALQAEAALRAALIDDIGQAIQAAQGELQAALATAQAKREAAAASGDISDAEQAEINSSDALVAAKQRQVQALEEAKRAKEAEGAASQQAADHEAQATEKSTQSVVFHTALVGRMTKELENYRNVADEAASAAFRAFDMSGVRDTQDYIDGYYFRAKAAEAAGVAAAEAALALDNMTAAQAEATAEFNRSDIGLAEYISRLNGLSASADNAAAVAGNVGEEKLQTLRDALEDAKRKMEDFAQSSQDGLASLQVEWAQLTDQQIQVEQLRGQQRRLEIEAEIAKAQADGNAAALAALQRQLQLLDQITNKRVSDAKAKEQADTASSAARTSPAAPSAATPAAGKTIDIRLSAGSQTATLTGHNQAQVDQLLKVLKQARLSTA